MLEFTKLESVFISIRILLEYSSPSTGRGPSQQTFACLNVRHESPNDLRF